MEQGLSLDASTAQIVANAMKDWALEKVRPTTHPLVPANDRGYGRKHDSFISPHC